MSEQSVTQPEAFDSTNERLDSILDRLNALGQLSASAPVERPRPLASVPDLDAATPELVPPALPSLDVTPPLSDSGKLDEPEQFDSAAFAEANIVDVGSEVESVTVIDDAAVVAADALFTAELERTPDEAVQVDDTAQVETVQTEAEIFDWASDATEIGESDTTESASAAIFGRATPAADDNAAVSDPRVFLFGPSAAPTPESVVDSPTGGWVSHDGASEPDVVATTDIDAAAPTEAAPTQAAPTRAAPTQAAPVEVEPTQLEPAAQAPAQEAPVEAAFPITPEVDTLPEVDNEMFASSASDYNASADPQWSIDVPVVGSIFDPVDPVDLVEQPSPIVDSMSMGDEVEATLGSMQGEGESFSIFDADHSLPTPANFDSAITEMEADASFGAPGPSVDAGLYASDEELPLPDFTGVYDESGSAPAQTSVQSSASRGVVAGSKDLESLRPIDEPQRADSEDGKQSRDPTKFLQFLWVMIFAVAVMVLIWLNDPVAIDEMRSQVDSLLGRS